MYMYKQVLQTLQTTTNSLFFIFTIAIIIVVNLLRVQLHCKIVIKSRHGLKLFFALTRASAVFTGVYSPLVMLTKC